MTDNKLKAILDNFDYENNEEYLLTKEEREYIFERNFECLERLDFKEFIANVSDESYIIGLTKGLLIAGVHLPNVDK